MYSRVSRIDSIHMFDEFNPNAPFQSIKSADFMRNAIGLTYDYKRQTIYYSDIQKAGINSVFFNGSSHRVVLDSKIHTFSYFQYVIFNYILELGVVEGLAYEKFTHQLFYTCTNDATINSFMLGSNTSTPTVIVHLGATGKPRGIALDACSE